jgi:PmbA protein
LCIWDASLKDVSVEDKIQLALKMEKATLDYDEKIVLTNRATYGDSINYTYLDNSYCIANYYGRTMCFCFLAAIARDEKGMVNATDLDASNYFKDLDPITVGEKAAMKALSMLGGEPVPTQKGTVVLDHFVGAQILAVLSQALSASSWQRSRSFLKGKMGQEVGSRMVTVMDNGRLKGGLASAPFDGEGVPTKATRLIDEGVLQNLMYDSYSAAKDGTVSTGNAQRPGHQGLPTLGASNFYMQAGNKSPEEIIKGVDKGFYVLSVMQTGGVDPITGECSMSANGLWIENGELKQSVGGVTIATTLNELLQNISDIGNDLRQMPIFGTIGVPTLRVDNVMIGGVDT